MMVVKIIKSSALFSVLFLLLSVNLYAEDVIYLDYAASWPVSEEAVCEFVKVSQLNGNSSGFNAHAKRLREIENNAIKVIVDKLHGDPGHMLFTNSATAANQLAIFSVAHKYPKCHFITSKIEHSSVIQAFRTLEKLGYEVSYIGVDNQGHVKLDELKQSIKSETKLISIQAFNSEIGVQQDIQAIGKIANTHGVLLHCDASQSFGKYDINLFGADMITISGYKIGAPKGIAALYVKNKDSVSTNVGSRSTALIAAFAKAIEVFDFDKSIIEQNYNILCNELSKIDGVRINSSVSHIVSISIDGVLLEEVIDNMSKYSFSAGCSCSGVSQSHVMEAIGVLSQCTLRVSFSDKVSSEVLVNFARDLKAAIDKLRREKRIDLGCDAIGVVNE